MLLQIFLISTLSVVYTVAEAPLSRTAPYPAAGWRPQTPFNLPGEYLPPRDNEQQNQEPQRVDVQITQQRVDFAGQVLDNALLHEKQPESAYLPPNNEEAIFLKVQGLPQNRNPQQFVSSKTQPQRGRQRLANRPAKPLTQQRTQQPQQFFPQGQQQQQPQEAYPQPVSQYGAPANDEHIQKRYPDPRALEVATDVEAQAQQQDNEISIDALNAAVEAYNRAAQQPTQNGRDEADYAAQANAGYANNAAPTRSTQGQYYVLGPDNTLQRVMFTTSQDEEETRTNGFTAQLKYMPVGELRDPVFRYNNKGQLVRIVKK